MGDTWRCQGQLCSCCGLVAAAHGYQGGPWPGVFPEHTNLGNEAQPLECLAVPRCARMEQVPVSTDGELQQHQERRDHNYLNIMKGFIKYTWKTTQQQHKVKLLVSTLQTI